MADSSGLPDRIEALEIRAAHQDKTIDELNTVIADQWRELDRLKRLIARIDDQIAAVEHMAGSRTREPPPPHY
jgi:SlyX protein